MQPEIIPITNEATKTIAWNAGRIATFGLTPVVQVWLDNVLSEIQPIMDAPPPAMTQMDFDFGGPVNGFIVIK